MNQYNLFTNANNTSKTTSTDIHATTATTTTTTISTGIISTTSTTTITTPSLTSITTPITTPIITPIACPTTKLVSTPTTVLAPVKTNVSIVTHVSQPTIMKIAPSVKLSPSTILSLKTAPTIAKLIAGKTVHVAKTIVSSSIGPKPGVPPSLVNLPVARTVTTQSNVLRPLGKHPSSNQFSSATSSPSRHVTPITLIANLTSAIPVTCPSLSMLLPPPNKIPALMSSSSKIHAISLAGAKSTTLPLKSTSSTVTVLGNTFSASAAASMLKASPSTVVRISPPVTNASLLVCQPPKGGAISTLFTRQVTAAPHPSPLNMPPTATPGSLTSPVIVNPMRIATPTPQPQTVQSPLFSSNHQMASSIKASRVKNLTPTATAPTASPTQAKSANSTPTTATKTPNNNESGPIRATAPMWRCSRIMHTQRDLHPTVLSSLEGIVDQMVWFRENWYEEVLRQLRQVTH